MELKELESKRQQFEDAVYDWRLDTTLCGVPNSVAWEKLMQALSSLGIVLADPNGELLENPYPWGYVVSPKAYEDGQQDMLKAGYRQTYELEGK